MPRQLFRQEAIDAQREKFLGEATIARPVPAWVFTLLAAGTAALLIIVAVWGQYTRHERVHDARDAGAACQPRSREGSLARAGRAADRHRQAPRQGPGGRTRTARRRD